MTALIIILVLLGLAFVVFLISSKGGSKSNVKDSTTSPKGASPQSVSVGPSPIESLSMDGVMGFKLFEPQETVVERIQKMGFVWNPGEYALKKNSGLPFMLHMVVPSFQNVKTVIFDFEKRHLAGVYFQYNVQPQHVDICFEELSEKLSEKFGEPTDVERDKKTWNGHVRVARYCTSSGIRGVNIMLSDRF